MILSDKEFALVCFLVLMQNREGVLDKHPEYIQEKKLMLNMGYDAYSMLDPKNQTLVKLYHLRWHLDLPYVIEKYEKEMAEYEKHIKENPL